MRWDPNVKTESRGSAPKQTVLDNSDFKYSAPLSIMVSVSALLFGKISSLNGQNLEHHDSVFPFLVRGEKKRGTMTKCLFCPKIETKVTGNPVLIEK